MKAHFHWICIVRCDDSCPKFAVFRSVSFVLWLFSRCRLSAAELDCEEIMYRRSFFISPNSTLIRYNQTMNLLRLRLISTEELNFP